MVDTLLIDHDTVYNPRMSNDRLLLGLKGSMNEYELDLLRLRSQEACMAKAKRGQLYRTVPVGFIVNEDKLEKNPDLRVQQTIELVFKKVFELGSARQVSHWLTANNLDMPSRVKENGYSRIEWKHPRYSSVMYILQNPAYAGIYAYGRTQTKQELVNGRLRKTHKRAKKEELHVFIPKHHEGYIDEVQYDRIQKMLSDNVKTPISKGAARRGPALLSGLLRCKRCGRKLIVSYTGSAKNALRYNCVRGFMDTGEPKCINFGGKDLDAAVSAEILRVLETPAIEATRQAWEKIKQGQDDRIDALKLQLESVGYETQRAFRQYDAVDPENRLVTGELERRWNAYLDKQALIENKLHLLQAETKINALDWQEFYALSDRLGEIWSDPECDSKIKKRIIRTLVKEIIVDVNRETGFINTIIHWPGGVHTELSVRTRRRGQHRQSAGDNIRQIVRELALVCSDEIIASFLNKNGILTGMGNRWSKVRLTSFRSTHKIKKHNVDNTEEQTWLNLTQAGNYLSVTGTALRRAVERDELPAKHPLPIGPWIFNIKDLKTEHAQTVAQNIKMRYRMGKTHGDKTLNLFKSST